MNMQEMSMPMPAHYSYALVTVSVLISMLAAYAAFSLADRMRSSTTKLQRTVWLVCGSTAMGMGVWSMHYLGMLAMKLPVPVLYHVPTVIASLLMAVAAAGVTLTVVSLDKLSWQRLLFGGVLMGGGIGAMHYTGMAAMRSSAMHHYSIPLVLLSVLVAVVAATLSLWVGFAVRSRETHEEPMRLFGGTIMGLGIAAMHYTAMQAVSYSTDTMTFSTSLTVKVTALGETSVAIVAGLILASAVATSALEKKRFRKLQEAHKNLATSQDELLRIQQQLRDANELLSELSIRDGLTGLYNRRHFDSVLDTEWRRAIRARTAVSLLMMDVDCFKSLNDTYGHQRGDECLREIAAVLEVQPHRGHDIVARYGGEEFAILLPGATLSGAVKLAEAIRRAVRSMKIENTQSFAGVVTISIGVCSREPQVGDEPGMLVHDADTALYGAKQLGRDRVEIAGQVVVEA